MDDPQFCSKCGQDQTSGVHEEFCPGKPEVREGRTFREWKEEVNRVVLKIASVGCDDLADKSYWDMWDSGENPTEAAMEVLEDEGFPFDGDDEL